MCVGTLRSLSGDSFRIVHCCSSIPSPLCSKRLPQTAMQCFRRRLLHYASIGRSLGMFETLGIFRFDGIEAINRFWMCCIGNCNCAYAVYFHLICHLYLSEKVVLSHVNSIPTAPTEPNAFRVRIRLTTIRSTPHNNIVVVLCNVHEMQHGRLNDH